MAKNENRNFVTMKCTVCGNELRCTIVRIVTNIKLRKRKSKIFKLGEVCKRV